MSAELLGVASRWAVFTGLLIVVGVVVFRLRILRGDAAPPTDDGSKAFSAAAVAARLGSLGAVALIVGAIGRLGAELLVFRDPFEPWAAELGLLVGGTSFGTAWTAQVALGLFACVAFGVAARSTHHGGFTPTWFVAGALTLGLAFTPAFSGHAAGSQQLRALAISSDVLHVLAGGTWLGTLGVMAWVSARARARSQPIGSDVLIEWVARFSPMALGAAALLGVTGILASWLHLDAVTSLWRSPYGQRLLIKIGVLGVILGFGAHNWKKSRGKISVSGDPARLPGSVAAELAAGLAILLVTALLVMTPPPGE